jgi:hypothetical protein
MEELRRLLKDEVRIKIKNIQDPENRDYVDGLKPKINELLFEYLPNTITIKEMDALASLIYDMIVAPNYYLDKKEV